MKIQDIRGIAKTWSVDAKVGRSKMDMIRDILERKATHPVFARRMRAARIVYGKTTA